MLLSSLVLLVSLLMTIFKHCKMVLPMEWPVGVTSCVGVLVVFWASLFSHVSYCLLQPAAAMLQPCRGAGGVLGFPVLTRELLPATACCCHATALPGC